MSAEPRRSDDTRLYAGQWAAAEGQLYPLIMASPEAFQRAVTVVRAVADRLRSQTTVAELARAFTDPGNLALSAAQETGTPIGDLDAGVLASAGFRLRHQEITSRAGPAGDSPEAGAGGEQRQEQLR